MCDNEHTSEATDNPVLSDETMITSFKTVNERIQGLTAKIS